MIFLVTGGAGFIGSSVIRHLMNGTETLSFLFQMHGLGKDTPTVQVKKVSL